jgi:DNA-binding response OmpR family regulator
VLGIWLEGQLELRSRQDPSAVFISAYRMAIARNGAIAFFPRREFQVACAILSRCGEVVSMDEVADSLYSDDPEGGPDNARVCISVFVLRVRRKLAPLGVVLKNNFGWGHYPALLPIEAREAAE